MGRMDKICSGCQSGHCDGDHGGFDRQEDLRRCVECDEVFNRRSASLGSDVCPRCERKLRRRHR